MRACVSVPPLRTTRKHCIPQALLTVPSACWETCDVVARAGSHLMVLGTAGRLHMSSAARWLCTACRGGVTAGSGEQQSQPPEAALQLKPCWSSAALA